MIRGPLVVCDAETTGLSITDDRIVSFATVRIDDNGLVTRAREWLVNPGIPIPRQASDVHGILDADVKDCPTFKEVAEEIATSLSYCAIAGYNVERYDMPLLANEFARVGMKAPWDDKTVVVDAMQLFRKLAPHSLAGAVRFYTGREHDAAHDAMGDVLATVDVLQAMVVRHQLPQTPAELSSYYGDRRVDRAGKLTKNHHGEVCLGFGKHVNKTLTEVASTSEGINYLQWVMRSDVPADVKHHIRDAVMKGGKSA
jgi:DNA polymerase-3 subunit epsilon